MTRNVITSGPDSFVKQAAEVMAEQGFAALPVVDQDDRLVGIIAEADVLRDRLPSDPPLHLRRDEVATRSVPRQLVRGVMTAGVRSVGPTRTSRTSPGSSSLSTFAASRSWSTAGRSES
jgi:CBS domain-containing protein